jgi:vanillate O-demethylase ferredoxin subunit
LEIVPQGGAQSYPPGSHVQVNVMIAGAGGELADVRCYSLVGDGPVDGAYRIAVRRQPESRGGSRYMWRLQAGARIRISNPQNLFELSFGRPQYLLLAGGIGITPIVGMAFALERAAADFRLLYLGRNRAGMPFVDELKRQLGDKLCLFSREEGNRADLAREIAALHPQGELYMCGPLGLMDAVRREWKQAGRRQADLRFETFGSSGRFAPEPFRVKVSDQDIEVMVPDNKTMLHALREAGVDIMFDCLRGECGLCVVDVIHTEGELDHRDVFLSEAEKHNGRKLCTCVSRAVHGCITIDAGYRRRGQGFETISASRATAPFPSG